MPPIKRSNVRSRILQRLAALALSLTMAACGTTSTVQPAEPPGGGKALVYFIRKSYPPYIQELRVTVNGKLVATIANNDFVAVNIPLGTNAVLLETIDGKPLSFEMPIERAERLFVVLTGDVKGAGQAHTGYNEFTFYLNWSLRAYRVSSLEAEAITADLGKRIAK